VLSRHQGVEASAAGEPVPGLRLRGAYTYTDARFREYRVGSVDVGGNRVPGIAPHRFAASAWWSGRGAFAGAEVRTASETPVSDTDGAGALASPGYALLDLRVGATRGSRGNNLTPWIALTNALDRRYNASVVVNAFGGRFYEPGPGRALYLGLDLGFQAR
jgi:iron complex outermembrane recepter protein